MSFDLGVLDLGVLALLNNMSSTQQYRFFLHHFQYFAKTIFFLTFHFLSWDYSDTRPDEELNFINQWNFFTDPKFVATNAYIVLGTASTTKSGARFTNV
jgi:hypothetical protein